MRELSAVLRQPCFDLSDDLHDWVVCPERVEAADRILRLEAQVKELTVWRPMSTAPRDGTVIIVRHTLEVVALYWIKAPQSHFRTGWMFPSSSHCVSESGLLGWLPLPEARS